MRVVLDSFLKEVCEKTTENDQFPVLTSSKAGLFLQSDYFNKQVASTDNTGYKIIRRGQFTYRAMSDTGEFFPNMLECTDIGIVSPAYPVFEITKKNDVLPEYLKYYFKSDNFQYSIASFAQGSTRTSVKFSKLKTVSIDLPCVDKQRKIIDILNRTKALISAREKELQSLDNLIKARFVEMFGDPTINPKGYPIKSMSEIADYWNGLTYKPEDISENGTIVLRSSNIQNMRLDFDDTVRVNCKIGEKKFVKDNDILMCSRNGSAKLVGKVALIHGLTEPMSFGAFMMIIRSDYYPYLMTYYQLPAFRSQITTGATTTINQITGNMLAKVMLPVPDKDAVGKFASFVAQVDKSKFAVQKALDKAQLLFDSLMQKYFG